jgi:hypothetical protein
MPCLVAGCVLAGLAIVIAWAAIASRQAAPFSEASVSA